MFVLARYCFIPLEPPLFAELPLWAIDFPGGNEQQYEGEGTEHPAILNGNEGGENQGKQRQTQHSETEVPPSWIARRLSVAKPFSTFGTVGYPQGSQHVVIQLFSVSITHIQSLKGRLFHLLHRLPHPILLQPAVDKRVGVEDGDQSYPCFNINPLTTFAFPSLNCFQNR